MKQQTALSIYERKGVYGDEEKLVSSYKRLDKMLALIASIPTKPRRVLDLGCGTGHFAHVLSTVYPHAKIVGVDISQTALSIGKKTYPAIEFIKADAETTLPFKNNTFDLVISGEHIEHLRDVDTYLEEINRVTKIGGHLLVTTPNLASWMNRLLLLFGRQPWYLDASLRMNLPIFTIGNYRFPENPDAPSAGHLRLFTLDALKKLLAYYGFNTVAANGAEIFSKPILKHIDQLFARIPELSFGLILLAKKYEKK